MRLCARQIGTVTNPKEHMSTTIDHIIIAVTDLLTATTDYTTLLGRLPSWQGSHPDYGTANTLFQLENTYIELLAPAGQGLATEHINKVLNGRDTRLGGLVFGTEDAAAFIGHARKQGLAASDPVPGHGVDTLTGAERGGGICFGTLPLREVFFLFVSSTRRVHHCAKPSLPAQAH